MEAVARRVGRPWACDPMHGNTLKTDGGTNTRPLERSSRLRCFFAIAGLARAASCRMTGGTSPNAPAAGPADRTDLADRYRSHATRAQSGPGWAAELVAANSPNDPVARLGDPPLDPAILAGCAAGSRQRPVGAEAHFLQPVAGDAHADRIATVCARALRQSRLRCGADAVGRTSIRKRMLTSAAEAIAGRRPAPRLRRRRHSRLPLSKRASIDACPRAAAGRRGAAARVCGWARSSPSGAAALYPASSEKPRVALTPGCTARVASLRRRSLRSARPGTRRQRRRLILDAARRGLLRSAALNGAAPAITGEQVRMANSFQRQAKRPPRLKSSLMCRQRKTAPHCRTPGSLLRARTLKLGICRPLIRILTRNASAPGRDGAHTWSTRRAWFSAGPDCNCPFPTDQRHFVRAIAIPPR